MDGYGIFPCIDTYHVNITGRCKARHCVQRTPECPNSQSVCHEVHAFANKADVLKFHFAVVDSTFWWLPKDHEHPRGHIESSNQRNAYIWTYFKRNALRQKLWWCKHSNTALTWEQKNRSRSSWKAGKELQITYRNLIVAASEKDQRSSFLTVDSWWEIVHT